MDYLKIRNWDEFQSHGKRRPPWIKLHRCLLESRDWINASDKDRNLMIVCLILASESPGNLRGCVPNDAEFCAIRGGFGAKSSKHFFRNLLKSGFLVQMTDAMSTTCQQDVVLEKRREEKEERREERERNKLKAKEALKILEEKFKTPFAFA